MSEQKITGFANLGHYEGEAEAQDNNFKIEWSNLIVDIVKKKDLDTHDFANCWEENYDWTDLDSYVVYNFRDLLIAYGQVEADRLRFKWNTKDLNKDLDIYIEENLK